ncbi:DUF4376 domain-containing protein [Pseudomonas sp. RIT-PI-S]|uniref:DUF4376 domain-containing protein n=1 Tax=Pseudomonas sp. RIT-PI-S TaxID=3035295 RepID=UPI0021D82E94|nr:DUF4376 domain-containing protein [Pseudomonas sp. RIT-PI-S]
MTHYARVENGLVAELFETDADISTLFHPDLVWVSCEGVDGVDIGWTYAKKKFAAPQAPTKTDEQKRADIAARRYVAEAAGIKINGISVDSDRDSQALITGAALAASLDASYTCNWKAGDTFVKLDAQTLLGIAMAMRAHVQACFDREAELLTAMKQGSYTEAMLDEGWPS